MSFVLAFAASACVYLIVLNRFLIGMRDGAPKRPLIRAVLVAFMCAAAAFGWLAAGTRWMLLPMLVLALIAAGEAQRWWIRRRCRGAGPVERIGPRLSWRKPVTTTDLALARDELCIPSWRGPDLRVVHVSDLHLNGDLSLDYYRAALARVAAAEPDLLFYTGDFVTTVKYAALLPGLLAGARGRLGTLAVLGNHDYWVGAGPVADALRLAGVTLLENECRRIAFDGHQALICGYEGPRRQAVFPHIREMSGELTLLLTHTPDNIYQASRLGLDAVFAGHFHAGQVRLPWLGALVVPSRYGRRFDHGHFVVNGTHLFVTAGVGSAVPPKRIYCPPDVFVVDLRGDRHV